MEIAGTLHSVEISHYLLKPISSHTFQKPHLSIQLIISNYSSENCPSNLNSLKKYQALDLNSRLPPALNNIAVIYHYQGVKASEKRDLETARTMFDKAAEYWKQAIRLAPNNYIEAQNWLKTTGRMSSDNMY